MKTKTCIFAILLVGGLSNSHAQDTWTQKADFGGVAREGATGLSIGSKGYIGLGAEYPISYKDFWEYDPDANTWTQKADFGGHARLYAVGFTIDGKGYVGTGQSGAFPNYTYYKDFWAYDPNSNTWTRKSDFGGAARFGAGGFSIESKGYLGTGTDGAAKKDFWEYDPIQNTWTQKADFGGIERQWGTGLQIGVKGYLGLGLDSNGITQKDFWEYDPATNTWLQKADFGGIARLVAAGFTIDNKGYIGTGENENTTTLKDFWEFDPTTNTWAQKADFGGTGRNQAAGFSLGSKGYIGTGVGLSYEKDFWEYTPDGVGGLTYDSAFSEKGVFDIDLPLTGGGVECRRGGGHAKYEIYFVFNNNLTSVGSATTTCGSVANATVDPDDAHQAEVDIVNARCGKAFGGDEVTVTVNDLVDDQGNTLASASITFCLLLGDVNGDGVVDSADAQQTHADQGQPTDSSNFREDVDNSGTIDAKDSTIVKKAQGTSCP